MSLILGHDWHSWWLLAASFLAGSLNAMAGGGSFLTFPALLGAGIAPIQANATNTVALWPGQFTSIAGYREDIRHNLKLTIPMGIAALLGGFAGAIALLRTTQGTFMALVPWLLLVAALLFAASGPISRWLGRRIMKEESVKPAPVPLFLGMTVICFYIGYFGAGAGFLIISLLALFGIQKINEINALKVVSTTLANGIAVVTFIVRGQVLWQHCLLMMTTAAAGGYLGARTSRQWNAKLMKAVVVGIGLTAAAYFFWKQIG